MSSRSRLLLLSGGPGTADAAVAEFARQGQRTRLVTVPSADGEPDLVGLVRDSVGRLMGGLGAEPLPASIWTSLAAFGQLSALWTARELTAEPDVDVVVLEVGPGDRAREIIELPGTLVRLLDAALTPQLAMWRTTEDASGSAFDGLSRLRGELNRLIAMLEHPRTLVRLVVEPDAVGETVRLMPVFPLLGVGVEGVAARVVGDDGAVSADWFVGPWPDPVRLTAASLSVLGDADGGYDLLVPLVGDARREAVVGRCGPDLIVEYAGRQRWLPLPGVLVRCTAEHAVREAPGLRVRFAPDPALWPQREQVPA